MNGMESKHCQIVKESISGARAVDEQTLSSVAVLTDRLERVKELGAVFSDVGFSSAIKELVRDEAALLC